MENETSLDSLRMEFSIHFCLFYFDGSPQSISYCPHPTYDQFLQGAEQEQEKVKEVQFADDLKDKNKKIPSKYESLALSYGNRLEIFSYFTK